MSDKSLGFGKLFAACVGVQGETKQHFGFWTAFKEANEEKIKLDKNLGALAYEDFSMVRQKPLLTT